MIFTVKSKAVQISLSVISGIIFSFIPQTLGNLSFIFGGIFAVICYLVLGILSESNSPINQQKGNSWLQFINYKTYLSIYFLLLLATVILAFYKTASETLYLNWISISPFSYLTFGLLVLVGGILPNLTWLSQIVAKNMGIYGKLAIACILTIFTTSVFGMASSYMHLDSIWVILTFSAVVFAASSIRWFFSVRKKTEISNVISWNSGNWLLIALIVFSLFSTYCVYFTFQSGVRGDMWRHFSLAMEISNYGYATSTFSHYPLFYPNYISTLVSASGFPSLNMFLLATSALFVVGIVTFYFMVKTVVGSLHPKVPILATMVWSLFSSFDWIYLVTSPSYSLQDNASFSTSFNSLFTTGLKTFSGITYSPAFFGFDHGLFLVSLIASMAILGVSWKYLTGENEKSKGEFLVIALLSAIAYLADSSAYLLFLLMFIPTVILFMLPKRSKGSFMTFLSLLAGVIFVGLFDIFSSNGNLLYVQTNYKYLLVFFGVSLVVTAIISKLNNGISDKLRTLTKWVLKGKILPVVIVLSVLDAIYFLSFFALNSIYPNMPTQAINIAKLSVWYIYPLRLGVAGLLVLLFLNFYVLSSIRKRSFPNYLTFSLAGGLVILILGKILQVMNIFSIISNYEELRVLYIFFIPAAIISGFVLLKISKIALGFSRKKIGSAIIIILMLVGSMSTVLTVEFWREASNPWGDSQLYASPDELSALSLIRSQNPQATILTTDFDRESYIVSLGGFTPNNPKVDVWSIQSPESLFFAFDDMLNIKPDHLYGSPDYIYMKKDALNAMKTEYPNSYLINYLLKLFPVIYDKGNIIVYKVESVKAPSLDSNLALVSSGTGSDVSCQTINFLSASSSQYTVVDSNDPALFNFEKLILSSDMGLELFNSLSNIRNWQIIKGNWTLSEGNLARLSVSDDRIIFPLSISDYSYTFKMVSGENYPSEDYGIFRALDKDHYYLIGFDGSRFLTLYKYHPVYENGTRFDVLYRNSTIKAASNSTYNFKINVVNSKIEVFLNETLVVGYDDPSGYNLGGIGFRLNTLSSVSNITVSPEQQFNTPNILSYVNRGGQVYVLDTLGLGEIADSLGITYSNDKVNANGIKNENGFQVTFDKNIEFYSPNFNSTNFAITSSYTLSDETVSPFTEDFQLGAGKITYVFAKPLFSFIESLPGSKTNETYTLFNKIGQLLSGSENGSQLNLKSTPATISVNNFIDLFGNVKINFSSAVISNNDFSIKMLSSSAKIKGTNSSTDVSSSLNDDKLPYLISSLKATNAILSIADGHVKILPVHGDYVKLVIDSDAVLNLATTDGKVTFKTDLNNSTELQEYQATDGTLTLELLSQSTFQVSQINAYVSGLGNFSVSYFDRPYASTVNCWGSPVQFNGVTSFLVESSHDSWLSLGMFSNSGEYNVISNSVPIGGYQSAASLLNLPWLNILPWFLLLSIIIVIIIIRVMKIDLRLHMHVTFDED